jgi:glycosyltransferase involved in cell wall biosynthesis
MKVKKIYILWQFDPRGEKIGGVGKYVLSLIKEITEQFHVVIVGITSNKNELGKEIIVNANGFNVSFLPVCLLKNNSENQYIPLFIKFIFGLNKYKKTFSKESIIFCQRFEYAFADFDNNNKIFINFHYDIINYLDKVKGESWWKNFPFVYDLLLKKVSNKVNGFFSVNNNTCFYLNTLFKRQKSVFFSPTWADNNLFYYSDEQLISRQVLAECFNFNHDLNKYYMLSVGRINKSKNLIMMLDCIRELPSNIMLLIAGDGPELDNCVAYTKKIGISEKVIFMGRVEHEKLRDLYIASDLYVSTSLTEGMSIALMESLACGTPVLTFNTGEAELIIKDGINGKVVYDFTVSSYLVNIIKMYNSKNNYNHKIICDSISDYTPNYIVSSLLEKIKSN